MLKTHRQRSLWARIKLSILTFQWIVFDSLFYHFTKWWFTFAKKLLLIVTRLGLLNSIKSSFTPVVFCFIKLSFCYPYFKELFVSSDFFISHRLFYYYSMSAINSNRVKSKFIYFFENLFRIKLFILHFKHIFQDKFIKL